MSTQNVTDPGAGQAVASINKTGNDDFASLLDGGQGSGSGESRIQQKETVVQQGNAERPELVQTTPTKAAGAEGTAPQQGQTAATTQQAVVSPTGIDKSVLDQIVETATRAAAGASQQGQQTSTAQIKKDQKELTVEEFNAKYQLPEINETTIQGILSADPKVGAQKLQQLLMRIAGSAVLMSNDVIDRRLNGIREEMSPHINSWQAYQKEQREQKLEADFYKSNPDLVNERPLVKEMQDALFGRIASGQVKPFTRPEDALKAVAELTRSVLTRMGKSTTGAGSTQGQTTQSSQSQGQSSGGRQMATASTQGQSGGSKSASKQSDVEEVFGADAV